MFKQLRFTILALLAMLAAGASSTLAAGAGATQDELTEQLTDALNEALVVYANVTTYTQGTTGLISSDATNMSTNASSLSLTTLVNSNYDDYTETWSNYPSDDAYLQVDLTGYTVTDLYITIVPRNHDTYYYDDTPASWIVTASNDGSTWDYIGEYATDGTQLAKYTLYTYPVVPLGAAYTYVRFTSPVALNNRTNNTKHFSLSEFQIYEATAQDITDTDLADKVATLQSAIAAARAAINANTATEEGIATLEAAVAPLANNLDYVLANYVLDTSSLYTGDGPGFYSQANINAYNAAYAAAQTLASDETATDEQISTAIDGLIDAYNAANEIIPVTDGYYYLVNAYSEYETQQGVKKAMFTPSDGNLWWTNFDNADGKQIFLFTQQTDGNFIVQNYGTGLYIAAPTNTSSSSQHVLTTEYAASAVEQIVEFTNDYYNGAAKIYSTDYSNAYHTNNHKNGAGYASTIVGWNNAAASRWYLTPVTETDWTAVAQQETTDQLAEALTEASEALESVTTYTQGSTGLIESDASNLSSNASSLSLTNLVDGNLSQANETWSNYPTADAYLQVDLTDKNVTDFYITIAPRTGEQYYNDTPKSWIVTASNDGSTWSYIGEYATDGSQLAVGSTYTYPVVNLGAAYTYVRFTSPRPMTLRTSYLTHFALSEFQLYEATAAVITDTELATAVTTLQSAIETARTTVTANTTTESDITTFNAAVEGLKQTSAYAVNNLADALNNYVLDTSGFTIGEAPGFYSQANIDAYNAAYETASTLDTGTATAVQINAAADALIAAYNAASEVIPITEGYYYIVSAGNGSGYSDGPYDDENEFALYNASDLVSWRAWDKAYDQIYYFTDGGDGNWYAMNLSDNTYISYSTSSYGGTVIASATADYTQVFTASDVTGKWIMKSSGNSYMYALTGSHNGAVDATSGNLTVWGSASEANNYGMNLWYLIPAKTALNDLLASADDYTVGSDLCQYTWSGGTSTEWNSKKAEFEALAANEEATIANLAAASNELNTMLANLTLNMPQAGMFLRIQNYAGDNYYITASNYTDNTNNHGDILSITASQDGAGIFYFDGTHLLAYPNGYYVYTNSTGYGFLSLSSTVGENTTIGFSESTYGDLTGHYFISFVNSDGDTRYFFANNGKTDAGTSPNNLPGYTFMLEEVNSLSVTLNGTSPYYATINLPVAVTLPSGLAAYSVTEGDNYLTLSELTASTIPANTPVLLYSETGATFDLTTADDESSALSTGLNGTVAAATVDALTHYVLGSLNSVVGFYQYNNTEMPGFKAYFTPSTTSSNAFSLVFPDDDDDLTAVDGIDAEGGDADADAPYYDLQGRKVAAPMKGQIYIHAGKKVRY